jgi:hypothetical protein
MRCQLFEAGTSFLSQLEIKINYHKKKNVHLFHTAIKRVLIFGK